MRWGCSGGPEPCTVRAGMALARAPKDIESRSTE
jgi:hypothetical protein